MPCYTIQTTGVKLAVSDMDLLFAALENLKFSPVRTSSADLIRFGNGESFSKVRGELSVTSQERAALIKRAYSAEIVKSQARKFGWQLKETAPYQFQVMKR